MCGFLVVFTDCELSEKKVFNALKSIQHRGPDNLSLVTKNIGSNKVWLGHARLSIQDLSDSGHQPITFDGLSIVFNGEIYNFREVREELIRYGYSFYSSSDTEVLLKAFHKWGEMCLEKLNGMFAFCIINEKTGQIFAARDRLGIKPLFYTVYNKTIILASELKAILALDIIPKKIDEKALYAYIWLQYVPDSISILKGVNKLKPGTYLTSIEYRLNTKEYWNLVNKIVNDPEMRLPKQEPIVPLEDQLANSIKYRLIADVEVGCFLSSGVDSSLIASIMSECSAKKVKTFSIGFHEREFNEADLAKKFAKEIQSTHIEKYISPDELLEKVSEISSLYDEPFADSSAIPTKIVSELAKEHVKVVLSGDGGDELFCGYNRYKGFKYMKLIPKGIRPVAGKLASFSDSRLLQKLGSSLSWNDFSYQYSSLANGISFNVSKKLFRRSFDLSFLYNSHLTNIRKSLEEKVMLTDIETYLPGDILTKVDRASMSVGLEARTPFLDHHLVEFAFTVPFHYKMNKGITKKILRDLLKKRHPHFNFETKKKGFAVPLDSWLRNELKSWSRDVLTSSRLNENPIIEPKFILEKVNNHMMGVENNGQLLWSVLMFELWRENFGASFQ